MWPCLPTTMVLAFYTVTLCYACACLPNTKCAYTANTFTASHPTTCAAETFRDFSMPLPAALRMPPT